MGPCSPEYQRSTASSRPIVGQHPGPAEAELPERHPVGVVVDLVAVPLACRRPPCSRAPAARRPARSAAGRRRRGRRARAARDQGTHAWASSASEPGSSTASHDGDRLPRGTRAKVTAHCQPRYAGSGQANRWVISRSASSVGAEVLAHVLGARGHLDRGGLGPGRRQRSGRRRRRAARGGCGGHGRRFSPMARPPGDANDGQAWSPLDAGSDAVACDQTRRGCGSRELPSRGARSATHAAYRPGAARPAAASGG